MIKHSLKQKIKIISIIIIVFLASYIVIYFSDIYQAKKQSTLLNDISENVMSNVKNQTSTFLNSIENEAIEKNERMVKVEELKKQNSDLVGWIEIPNTPINYPVMQGNDNEFYLNRNYEKQITQSGSIFIDADYKWNPKNTNLLMYGHNMKNGTMFTSLLNYKNRDYYLEHPNIRFTTATTDANYEIIAAFESKVYDDSDDSFKYYNFINATNKKEFDFFIFNIKSLTPYDTNNTATFGDDLITLSTCAYHTKDGRFAVVGKSLKD